MTGVKDVVSGLKDYRNWLTDPRPRIGWGLPFFDARTNGGLARQEICMVQAYSYVGKTTLGLNIIRNNPEVPALMFSVEMAWPMVVARLAAMDSGYSTTELEQDLVAGRDNPAFQATVDKFRKLVCDDTAGITIKQFDRAFEDATEAIGEPPRLILIDYLELIGGNGMLGKSEQVDKLAQQLRAWTRNHNCSTIVLHQVGKGDGGSGAEPLGLDSGRYGGFQPMDYVVGAYRPSLRRGITPQEHEECREEIVLQLLKNRAGQPFPSGEKHRMDAKTGRLSEWREQLWAPAPASYYQEEF